MYTSYPDGFIRVSEEQFDRVCGSLDVEREHFSNVSLYRQKRGDKQVFGYKLLQGSYYLHPDLVEV